MPPTVPLRPYYRCFPFPPQDPSNLATNWQEPASFPLLLETLSRHSEITSFGKKRFSGNVATKNLRWHHYRNLMRQAISNFRAALEVPNRSACLLYYYAMLNFAKAELLDTHFAAVTGRLYHGLSFDPTKAKTVAGDTLKVHDGAFRLLYEKRTDRSIPVGTLLSVKKILSNIPEVGQQMADANLGATRIRGVMQTIVSDGSGSWPVLAILGEDPSLLGSATNTVLEKFFERVDMKPQNWTSLRESLGLSRQFMFALTIYQSRSTAPNISPTEINILGGLGITRKIIDILGMRTDEQFDAFLAPSFYKDRLLVMPPSLCRYAISFYASSLVRYRPSMFDSEKYPEQAYMFDAIARECALPMLIDTLAGLEGREQFYHASNWMKS